jgi:4-hydroxy-tetrahydrodipicolinate reductase
MKPIKLCLAGADGRMGSTIIKEIERWPNIEISGALTASDSPNIGESLKILTGKDTSVKIWEANNIKESLRDADIYLSFTTPQAEIENLPIVADLRKKIVIGTTGFTEEQRQNIITNIKDKVPSILSPNFAIGVNILWKLLEISKIFPKNYDFSIVEIHHTGKSDSPSGTARKIEEIITKTRGYSKTIYGRRGISRRETGELETASLRLGGIPGIHEVLIAGPYELMRVEHTAFSRQLFAQGALLAVKWIHSQEIPGIYTMSDVLSF